MRLGDVAKVTDSVEDRNSSGYHNDRPSVLLMVSRQPGANIVATIDAINAELRSLRALLPGDADLAVVMDRSPAIRATLRESQHTLILSVALVVVVVFGFLGSVRGALITSVAIPVSIIGTFALMYLKGFSLNNLSLMALIVAAGLVVDDAIVVLENISRHIEAGMPPAKAAMKGAGEVGFTLLAMTLSLVTVFVSILFMGGLVERLFREFSLTLAAAMLVSLLISLTLTPSLCARWLKHQSVHTENRYQRLSRGWFDRLRAGYARTLGWVLGHSKGTLLVLLGIVALNLSLYYSIPKGFLPEQDTGQLQGFVRGFCARRRRILLPDHAAEDRNLPEAGDGRSGGARHRRHDRRTRGHGQRLDDGAPEAARRAQGLGPHRRGPVAPGDAAGAGRQSLAARGAGHRNAARIRRQFLRFFAAGQRSADPAQVGADRRPDARAIAGADRRRRAH